MLTDQVDVDADFVDDLNVHLLKTVCQTILIHILLHRVKVESKHLVLGCDRTPKVKKLTERILLKPSQ